MSREPSPQELMESLVGDLQKLGYSCREIAKQSGVAHSTIWRASSGMATHPLWNTYSRLKNFHERAMAGRKP
ncbi:hypothetical protein IB262_21240 [Ensifer sp. ENS02]|uniref:hypothetical protein n=1 Tax=Ensifer sp. ENS02 TaxID=2769290 RepID=UPI001785809D|nr:hypothetical protein [Ensifer sp. ENS02]MBD9522424.1 hypothetical protein [Ensifer sp. ENS02]